MKTRIALFVLLALAPTFARADVVPNPLCTEGMVLQQKSTAKIWGKADPGENVAVNFRNSKSVATADDKGKWVVTVETGNAGGPFEMTIAGKNTISYKNVLVGEVWLCSGQSNMEWKVAACDKPDKDAAMSAKPNPMLRIFHVPKSPQSSPQTDITKPNGNYGKWIEAAPNTVLDFTATGYFFGRNLQENLKVPVGLVHSSWGGTRIETWMNAATLDPFEKQGDKTGANAASNLYNGMIHPLLNYRIKGAIWYQGESNAGNAYKYRAMHPAMIEQWRKDFNNPDMPFYFVQLAPFQSVAKMPGESNWAELREAQMMTLKLKNTGMAVITDFGDEVDIHPTPKQPVGERLALAARGQTYGEKIVYSGPIYKSVKFDGARAILTFDHTGGGLRSREIVATPSRNLKAKAGFAWRQKEVSELDTALVGFTMAGKDKVFQPAIAEIRGDTVVVTSKGITEPVAVRYGWANHPVCNLYNREGLPASPFRTDTFPGVTQPK